MSEWHHKAQPLTADLVSTTSDSFLLDAIVEGELLILTFAFVAWDSPPQFDFYGRVRKLTQITRQPINLMLLRDCTNHWYHRGIPGLGRTVDAVAQNLQAIIQTIQPCRVVTIGQSMGAYAAIMFGQLLGVDQVLAFGPLSFLNADQARAIADTRWLSIMEELDADPPDVAYFDLPTLCQQSPHTPDLRIFYGKKPDPDTPGSVNLDHIHATRFSILPNCTLQAFENSGHAVVKHLIDNHLIDQLLLKTIFDVSD